MEYKKGDRFILADNPRFGTNDGQGRGVACMPRFSGGREVIVHLDGVDGDGDVRVRLASPQLSKTETFDYVSPKYLLPVGNAVNTATRVPGQPDHIVTAATAWANGNEIEFTVNATESDMSFAVGCKEASKADVWPLIQEYKKLPEANCVQLTLRTIVRNGCVHIGAASANFQDIRGYGREFKLISTEEAQKPDVTVTLTHAQAEAIGALYAIVGGKQEGYRGHASTGLLSISKAAGYDNHGQNPAYVNGKLSGSVLFND